jgi:hypothetical protein
MDGANAIFADCPIWNWQAGQRFPSSDRPIVTAASPTHSNSSALAGPAAQSARAAATGGRQPRRPLSSTKFGNQWW